MSTLSKIALAASAVATVGTANATVITTTVSLNQLLSSSSGVYTGAFAINPFLAANNLSGGTVLSATISAYGYSDIQINSSGQTGYNEQYMGGYSTYVATGSYTCGSWGWSACYGYANYGNISATSSIVQADTIVDTMKLSTATTNKTGSDGRSVSSTDTGMGSYTRNNGTYGYDTVYMTTHTTTDVTSGALGTGLLLSAADLLVLAQSGMLNFSVAAASGQFTLSQFAVTLDVREFAVPEPATAALMLAGLAGLAAAARGRRVKKTT